MSDAAGSNHADAEHNQNKSDDPNGYRDQGSRLIFFWGRVCCWIKGFFNFLNRYVSPILTAVATTAIVSVAVWQWSALDNTDRTLKDTLKAENSLLDLTTRAIVISQMKSWHIAPDPPEVGKSPTITFDIKNIGHTHAVILMATYQYAVADKIPLRFGAAQRLPDFPALLSPEVDWSLAVANLPQITADEMQAISAGRLFLWLKTIFDYRDDRATQYEIRFTGRYGRVAGKDGFGFAFPDADIPREHWGNHNFGATRCLNIINPMGCRD